MITAADVNLSSGFIGGINPTADVNAGATGGIIQGVEDFFGGLAGLFNNGVEIYKSVAGQYAAAQAITKQTINPNPTVVNSPGTSSLLTKDNLIKIGVVVAVGILALLIVRKR